MVPREVVRILNPLEQAYRARTHRARRGRVDGELAKHAVERKISDRRRVAEKKQLARLARFKNIEQLLVFLVERLARARRSTDREADCLHACSHSLDTRHQVRLR